MDTLQLHGAGPDGPVTFCKKRREKALDLLGMWQSECEPEENPYVPSGCLAFLMILFH